MPDTAGFRITLSQTKPGPCKRGGAKQCKTVACHLQIDLRYTSREQGDLAVVVAPILRFADIGFNANVTIEVS
jgi:hypothetical protein